MKECKVKNVKCKVMESLRDESSSVGGRKQFHRFTLYTLNFTLAFAIANASALPLPWRADWPDAKPVETLVHRGTDVELQPTWFINKAAADTNGWTFTTFCQTNAVGPWFGPLPGAAFSHTNDVGAAFYNVMVRAQTPGGAVNYTAFARLRMLDSPGFTPGELPLPVPFIDFSKVVALNAPWLLPGATNDIGTIKVELGSISNSVSTLSAATATNAADIATLKDTTATLSQSLAGKADREIVIGQVLGLPDSCFPIVYAYNGESYSIVNSGGIVVNRAGPTYYGLYDGATGVLVCYFRISDGTYISNGEASGITFGGTAPTQLAWPVLGDVPVKSSVVYDVDIKTNYYTKAETDDAIDTYAAYYITYTAAGAAFPTHAALTNATVVYSGGAARTPTRNDYAVVLADESHGGAEWRYIYTVAAGATSGQWDAQYPIETNDYDALSNKPQINGVSLSGNKTGADLGVLDLSGGAVTGTFGVLDPEFPDIEPVFRVDGTVAGFPTMRFGDSADVVGIIWRIVDGGVVMDVSDILGTTYRIAMPSANGTLALSSDISAAISPTSPAFSNAVLSVGLGIDTNTVAVINELVDASHDLPVTGATSVGALLLALAAAIAALKKRLPYALVAKTIENGAVTLDDRASNAVTISATLSPNTLTVNFPTATSGKVRDFALRLNIAAGVTAPELVLPQGVVCENTDGEVPEISDGGTGGSSTILYFSETENNGTTAKFLLKGETLAAITQA